MRIAVLADLALTMPPPTYGGIQRFCWYLSEELVRRGHEVTLLGCADARTSARLLPCAPTGVWSKEGQDYERDAVGQLTRLAETIDEFDVVHSSIDYFTIPLQALAGRRIPAIITTVHGRVDRPDIQASLQPARAGTLVAISHAQRASAPGLPWGPTIHHGLPTGEIPWHRSKEGFLVFLGRLHPEKGVLEAIDLARAAGRPLTIAGWVGELEQAWFEQKVAPRLGRHVSFIGPVDDRAKYELLSRAAGLLFPISWPEPFGLVLIEALACGTPVAAVGLGSVPEIIEHGRTGVIAERPEELARHLELLLQLDPATCRQVAEQRFDLQLMADRYEALLSHHAGLHRAESGRNVICLS